ncbi:hypothetical protein [Desulfoferrobacter suflitae]|uniref:hypothetical protein n=1 Tax=Desulfoferrobacter suflitae TaxID=2865782 RepID=UPI0021645D67|nr:hypothetical protein [Desulfoferrobacter suflitae]MCK8604334.1 hypothetical protein [Desulfoferrobacter suflitae]
MIPTTLAQRSRGAELLRMLIPSTPAGPTLAEVVQGGGEGQTGGHFPDEHACEGG